MPQIQAIRDKLLEGLDKDYNVLNMGIVEEVISELENYPITKEALETTRLGKHINELRRKASDKQLASRAKSLVKKWRELLMPSSSGPAAVPASIQAPTAIPTVAPPTVAQSTRLTNGHHRRLVSPACNPSLPSSASSSPGLSRPVTPAPEPTPTNPVLVGPNKNKRPLDDPPPAGPEPKRANRELRPINCDNTNEDVIKADQGKKKARKKPPAASENLLEQKLLSARRSKVRTTQQLVDELALRSTSHNSNNNKEDAVTLNESKTELMTRFLQSQDTVLSPPLSAGSPENSTDANSESVAAVDDKEVVSSGETVDEVLSLLPPIDAAAILAEINSEADDVDMDGLIPLKKADEPLSDEVKASLVSELHSGQHESVNGNFAHDGQFREWHEVVTKETVRGDILYILPYSVIE